MATRLTADIGLGVDTSLAKNNNTTYFVQNVSSGSVAVSQVVQPTLQLFTTTTAVCASGQTVNITNPPNVGLYSVLLDFGVSGGKLNISTIANLGPAGDPSNNRWVGGSAMIAENAAVGGSPTNIIQVYPDPETGQQLVLANNSNLSLPAASVSFTQLSANQGF